MKPSLQTRVVAEFIGTVLLLTAVVGSRIMAENLGGELTVGGLMQGNALAEKQEVPALR